MPVITNNEAAWQLLGRFGKEPVVIDVETSGLDPRYNYIVGYVLTFSDNPADSFYVPVRHTGGGNLPGCVIPDGAIEEDSDPHWWETELSKVIWQAKTPLIGHNFQFDMGMMYRHDVHVPKDVEDTLVLAAMLNENAGRYSLDDCCQRAGVTPKKGEPLYQHMAGLFGGKPDRNQMANFWKLAGTDPVQIDYSCGDGTSTYQLWKKYVAGVERQSLGAIRRLEKKVLHLLFRMTAVGIRVDEEALTQTEKAINSQIAEMLQEHFGSVNPKSNKQIEAWLRQRGVVEFPRTSKGNTQVNEAFLKTIPQGQPILDVRQLITLRDSFLKPLRERHLHRGRVHFHFQQLKADQYGTVNGRLASYDPNGQAIPKRNKRQGVPMRRIFLPDEGMQWLDADQSQQEYRVFASFSGSRSLIQGYEQGKDIHQIVADMLGVERDPTAKRINLGVLYGMGLEKLAKSLNVSIEQAKEWRDRHREMVPEATGFMRAMQREAETTGYIRTPLGRRRRFPNGDGAHKAGNAMIQATCADIMKVVMVRTQDYFDQRGKGERVMLQVHDSLDSSVLDEEGARGAVEIMCDFGEGSAVPLRVPMKADWRLGPNYAIATYGEETCSKY